MVTPSSNEQSVQRSRSAIWAVLSIVAAVVWLYWPSLSFDFVNWDDPSYVANNELIRSWHPANLTRVASETVTRNYAPLTIFSLLLDHTVWGLQPTGYHLTNVVLHIINALLVYALLMQLTRNRYVAWTTALLFAVHPVQVETVVWISSRKGLLSAGFMLSSLIFWCREERTAKEEGIAIAFLVAALLSKAIAVMLPPVFLLYDVLVRRKPFSESAVRQLVPGFLAFILLTTTMSSQTSISGGLRDHLLLSKIQLLAVDTTLLWRYVGMLLCPGDLCVLYNPPTQGIALAVIGASAGLIAVAAGAWSSRREYPLVTLAVATFYLMFLPVLNLFPLTTLINDRYLYLPSIAFFALASGGMVWLVQSMYSALGKRISMGVGMATTVAAAAMLMLATSDYLPVWKNSNTLWAHAMKQAPELMVVRIQQAHTLYDQGRETDAMRVLHAALSDCPKTSVDRERIQKLLEEWLRTSAEADMERQRQRQLSASARSSVGPR